MGECGISWHTHDPGVVLTHLADAIADGADCLSDLAALREQQELFGPVASIPTTWRALQATSSLEQIPKAVATARERVWAASPPGNSLISDFDATLLTSFSDKQDAAPTYKKGFGFHPLVVHPMLVRPDSAGATHNFVRGLVEANCEFSIGFPVNAQVRGALLLAQEEEWAPAVELDGRVRASTRLSRQI